MKNMVLVIHENDKEDRMVIGVATSSDNALKLIKEYYGEYTELSHNDISDSNLIWEKKLKVKDHMSEVYEVWVWVEWFELNKV